MTLWQFIKVLFVVILPTNLAIIITASVVLNLITESIVVMLLVYILISIVISFFAIKWCYFVINKGWI